MQYTRRPLTIIGVLVVTALMCGCGSDSDESSNANRTQTRNPDAATMALNVTSIQNSLNLDGLPTRGAVLTTLAPGEVWEKTFKFKMPFEAFALDGANYGGDLPSRSLRIQVAENQWAELGLGAWSMSAHMESYTYPIWQLETDEKLLIPHPSNPGLDLEAVGKLSREDFMKLKWKKDPAAEGFNIEWDLRRGHASAYKGEVTVRLTIPSSEAWVDAAEKQRRGDIYFSSEYTDVGIALGLQYDSSTGHIIIREGSVHGGPLYCNPHKMASNDIF